MTGLYKYWEGHVSIFHMCAVANSNYALNLESRIK